MTPFPLARSDFGTKILITIFLLSMIAAFVVAELNVYDKVGRIKDGVVLRYGPEAPPPNLDQAANIDPANLPSENDIVVARMNTFSLLLDITHPHIFEIPLIIFVIAHFLMRTRVSEKFKIANYLLSFTGVILFIGSPWAVRYISIKTASMLYMGAILMGLTVLVMIVVSLWDMWQPIERRSPKT